MSWLCVQQSEASQRRGTRIQTVGSRLHYPGPRPTHDVQEHSSTCLTLRQEFRDPPSIQCATRLVRLGLDATDNQFGVLSHVEPHKILKAAVRVHRNVSSMSSFINSAIDARKTSLLDPAVLRSPSLTELVWASPRDRKV